MRRIKEDNQILLQIQTIKLSHPSWGYRRIWAYMKYRLNQMVNRKRIYRIMKEHYLLVSPNLRLKARRENQSNKNKPKAARANQFWGYRHDQGSLLFFWLAVPGHHLRLV